MDATDRLQPRVTIALIVAAVAISFAALCFEEAAVHPITAALVRMAIATIVVAPFGVRSILAGKLSAREAQWGLVGGAMYALHFALWIGSLGLTTVAASVTLATTTPIMLSVASIASGRDRPSRRVVVALVLSMLGVMVIGRGDFATSREAIAGDVLAVVSAAAMAVYLWVVRKLGRDLDLWGFTTVVVASAAAFLAITAIAMGVPLLPSSGHALLWLALSAIVPQVAGHGLLTWALRHTTPTIVGLSTTMEPAIASLLAWIFLGEVAPPITLVGCVITVAGVLAAIAPSRWPTLRNARRRERSLDHVEPDR